MIFSLASGNIAGAFEIVTSNDSIGEVFVAKALDREELDHYILKVSTRWLFLCHSQALRREPTSHNSWVVSFLAVTNDVGHVPHTRLTTVRLMGEGDLSHASVPNRSS